MTPSPTSRRRLHRYAAAACGLLTITLVPGLAQLPALAGDSAPAAARLKPLITFGDAVAALPDLDTRGSALPNQAQKQAVAQLGVTDVRWNQFGTPTSLLPADGSLGVASSTDPVTAARSWLRAHAAVFGLTAAQVDGLDLVNNARFAQSPARAVLFRQRFGNLTPALDSMVTVGVANGSIAYASSSITPLRSGEAAGTPPAARLTAKEAFLKAAANVGRAVPSTVVPKITGSVSDGWTRFDVPGFAQEQLTRLRALAMADGSVRPVFETNVTDVKDGSALAYTLMVDAVTGQVLNRQNKVDSSNDTQPFDGSFTPTTCGDKFDFDLTDDKTQQIVAAASADNAANDIVLKLYDPNGQVLAASDTGTSPEAITYAPGGTIPKGTYSVQVCPFADPTAPPVPPYDYAGAVYTSDQAGGSPSQPTPEWRFFPANPTLDWSENHTPKNDVIGCWRVKDHDNCSLRTGQLIQPFGPAWDYSLNTDTPTFTTQGNNAATHEAWGSPLTPGGSEQAPVSSTREYTDDFTDAWNNSRCDPSNLHPTGNDIFPVVTNLFVAHNRMHDYAYGLGFTERNYNLQQVNIDNAQTSRENDPEIGNAQAGALTGGQPTFEGRDNANQITEQDGVPGITNQYLFQPIAGAFYSPCTDGALDMGVVGHEYTHAITNRMIGGPDQNISSDQGGAMGESWGDLTASEYQFSHGYSTGVHPFIEGAYATGNKKVGIRDYAIYKNPLNYSDIGFDSTGPEVHADGEIWNGTQWQVRQALVNKWNKQFPYGNRARQHRCAEGSDHQGPLKSTRCPGNRRWISIMFDSFLLQQAATSMLDARDAMIAADTMRYNHQKAKHGDNYKALWDAYAKRGMGKGAKIKNADDDQPKPSFASPTSRNGTISFNTAGTGKIFVGDYEARVSPVADTLAKTKLGKTVRMVPGHYRMLYVSKKRGFKRFSVTVAPGQHRTVKVGNPVNLAAAASGAKVLSSSNGSLNAEKLIDGTERTNWGGVNGDGANVDDEHPYVVVDLAGSKARTIHRVNVSAMLNPAKSGGTLPFVADPDSGSRFTALRRFALERCVSGCSTANATWVRFYTSPAAAFPAVRPRPVAPNLTLRSFNVPNVKASAIRFVALENQCTGYAGYAGDQDNDPSNNTDCKTGSDRGTIVHAAELQVF